VYQFSNRFVQLGQAEEPAVTQRRQNPALDHQYSLLDFGFVPSSTGTRRHYRHAIVNRPFLIGSIQFRFPVTRLVDSGLPLIRHDQSRSAAEEIQRAGVGTDPIRQTASPRGFGVGVAAGAQHRYEDIGGTALAGRRIDYADRVAGVIDKGLFTGPVFLPQHHIQMPGPFAILLAEPTVVGSIGVLLDKLLPEQLQSDIFVGLQLVMDLCEVGLWFRLPMAFVGDGGRRRRE